MSVSSLRDTFRTLSADRYVSKKDVRKLFEAAKDGPGLEADERAALQELLDTQGSKFTNAAKREFAKLMGAAPSPAPTPAPSEPERVTLTSNHQPWTSTYWPMAGSLSSPDGSASSNLWAKDGPLDKFDKLLKARNKPTGALEHEKKPSLNWLVNKPSGYYIPESTVSEKDAERTTGVDLNRNGKLDEKVEWDFLDGRSRFGKDGKKDGEMSVGWWGSCDKVARAGILFKEPKKDVTIDGVTFTAQDIKGLLTVIADSQGGPTAFVGERYDRRPDIVELRNGTRVEGEILSEVDWYGAGTSRPNDDDYRSPGKLPAEVKVKLMDGTEKTYKASELRRVMREDQRDDAALFHETLTEWMKSGRPAAMDKDNGDHVWNYSFHKLDDTIYKNGQKPEWAPDELKEGYNGPPSGGKITFVAREVTFGSGMTETYKYWLEEKNGKVVNSGWVSYGNPDFLWRPSEDPKFTGHNARNPFIDPALVKEIYEKSIE
ncbi:MAG: hypothetical protein ACOZIN_13855 [Myxococcota bacterium]